MAEPSWDLNPDRLRADANSIRQIEQRIAQVPPDQRTNYQLRQMGIEIPPGYRLERDGRLKYVAVDNSQPWYNNAKIMIPLILGGGFAAGGGLGALGGGAADGGLSASVGAPAATEASIFGSPAATASAAAAAAGGGSEVARRAGDVARHVGTSAVEGTSDRLLNAAFSALAGLPAMLGKNGPSDEERAYQSQATRLLGQQEQRTQFQNPLYEAVTKMAHGLLPNMGNNGQPYPINGLNDVTVPTLDELIAQQRRT